MILFLLQPDALLTEAALAQYGDHQVFLKGDVYKRQVHTPVRVNAAGFVDQAVDPVKHRVGEGVFSGGDVIKVPSCLLYTSRCV